MMFLLTPFVISGCVSSSKKDDDIPTPEPTNNEISYKDIYHFDYQKSDRKVGLNIYCASDGYINNNEQGYNNFYYLAKTNDGYNNLIYEDGAFNYLGAKIKEKQMTSTREISATRCFIAPENGPAVITGSAFLISGTNAHISIYQNDNLIFEKDVDSDGVYHSNEVNLNKNDNIYFVLSGDASIEYNPAIDYTFAEEVSLHHTADGFYGDVHPFYDYETKKMYMFYLSTGMQSGLKHQTFESLLTTSTDFIHYNAEDISVNERGRPEQDLYYVLNVFKDKNGQYRSSMGTSNHTTTSVSDDLHVWSNGTEAYVDPVDDIFKYRYAAYYDESVFQGRDPDMVYDKDDDCYYTVSIVYHTTARASGAKSITLYIGNNKGEFASTGYRLLDFTGRGDPECPQIKKINNRWYLLYSVSGTGTKGNVGKLAYRVGDINVPLKDVNWTSKPELYLDGEDLHAAQINEVGDKYYQYGWLNYQYNTSVWGGYLNLPHEIYQDEDGTLRSKLDEELLRLLNKGLIYRDNTNHLENTDVSVKLTRNLIILDINMKTTDKAGINVTHGSDNYFIGVTTKANKRYLTIENEFDGYRSEVLAKMVDKYHLTISLDGNFLDVNVNDDTTISAYTNLTSTSKTMRVTSNGNNLTNLKIYHLADYNNIYF